MEGTSQLKVTHASIIKVRVTTLSSFIDDFVLFSPSSAMIDALFEHLCEKYDIKLFGLQESSLFW